MPSLKSNIYYPFIQTRHLRYDFLEVKLFLSSRHVRCIAPFLTAGITPREEPKCNDSLKWLTVNNENTVHLSRFRIKPDRSSTLAHEESFRSGVCKVRLASGEHSCGS